LFEPVKGDFHERKVSIINSNEFGSLLFQKDLLRV
jgi:hypothetical protein